MWFRSKPGKSRAAAKGRDVQSTPKTSTDVVLERVRLPVDLLQPGMKVVKLDRPWTEVPVLFQGFTLQTEAEARVLRQYCAWVVVEDEAERLAPVLDQIPHLKQRTTEPLQETRTLEQELPRAADTWSRTQQFVEKLIRDIEQNNDLELASARPLIRSCVDSVKTNASAMFWMARIKHRDAYTAEHCLRVAILTVAFARFLGLPEDDLEVAGMCGLLHDIGKLRVPDEILNKPGPLSPQEYEVMRKHTTLGHELLKQDPSLDPIISDVTLHHHERIDGRGYPQQLPEWQISRFARLIAIVDAYDAMTSDRCYRDGMSPADAVRILYKNRAQQFDADMVEAFIRMIGIYPPGSLVELNTGEVALVVSTHPGRKLKPKVEILLDNNKHPVTPRVMDLGSQTTTDGPVREIKAPLPDGAFGISLEGRVKQLMAKTIANHS
ncbi:HD-GYP domain-containing protein [Marinobacter nauticus]|uniref:HD-GYP domain-containing protein n=1 Tax=Marinobacter nauticus TaxID=2743 RepID=UPI001C99F482|nr:HD-GYP domain-containing protein [Marinobacter nauticus]MBY5937496.1 HD-GYP domain-containing protein [Marinobacter nauticus]MBY5954261.1 HD-GYP domain-containing protein [Marinobacter nauticus]MBY6008517.1 HD-GYP domain-containing protein [Marinobacter nauticus]MCA0913523.1 HD-GYP domain-containing protein [Marinobacter nauticus]